MSPLPSDPEISNLGWSDEEEHCNDSNIDLCSMFPGSVPAKCSLGYKSIAGPHNEDIFEPCLDLEPWSKVGFGEQERVPNRPQSSFDISEIEELVERVHRRPRTLCNTHTETQNGFGCSSASTTSSIGCNERQSNLNASHSRKYEDKFCSEQDGHNDIHLFDSDTAYFGFPESRKAYTSPCQVHVPHTLVSGSKKDSNDKDTGMLVSDSFSRKTAIPLKHSTHRKPTLEVNSEMSLDPEESDLEPEILFQPETRPISHEQLMIEVKSIYSGLVMVEAKCIDIAEKQRAAKEQDPSKQTKLSGEQWRALIALHKTLLNEHHDFFLATQHPSASPSLRGLPALYDMPRRMWQHGVHTFLELLLQRLPDSSNAMNAFIHEAYSTLEFLYEKVPMLRDTWIECLIDLDTYRQALDPGGYRFFKARCRIASSWFGLDVDSGDEVGDPARSRITQDDKTCLPMVINGVTIDGRHDTGADGNFLTYELATSLKLRIRSNRRKPKSLTLATGKIMRTVGRVHAWCTFAKEPATRVKCWFHVCSNLTDSLIMGSTFLAATKTLTQFKHRLQKRVFSSGSIPTVNLIGTTMKAQRRFACRVDGRLAYVNADSASDLDLVSPSYVKANKLHIDRRREVRKRIKLADQTQAETIGQVKAMINIGDGSENVYERVFDVLPGLTSEVLFGEDFLELVDAFCSHESSFVMVPTRKRHYCELNILENLGPVNNFLKNTIWGKRRLSNPAASLEQQRDDLDMAENRRHDREMARIRRLTGPDRLRDERLENQRVAEYERQRNPQSGSAGAQNTP